MINKVRDTILCLSNLSEIVSIRRKNVILFGEIYRKDNVFDMNLLISDKLELISKNN